MTVVLAETSKVPFYILGGLFALWAVVLSALGLSRDRFPSLGGGRAVMGLSFVLMAGAMATAVITASKPDHAGASALKPLASTEAAAASTTPASTPPTSSSSPAAQTPSHTISVSADPAQLKFTTTALAAKAGKDTLDFDNPSQIPHNVTLQGPGGKVVGGTKTIPHGKTSVALDLKPGTYTFYCSVPGHEEAGMKGQLTVK